MPRPRAMLLLASLRHTRARQVWHRLRLWLARRTGWALRSLGSGEPAPPVRPDAPRGHRDAPRVHGSGAERSFELVGQRIPLRVPLAWDVPGVTVGRPLAELEVHYLEFLRALDDADFVAFSRDWIAQNGTPRGRYWATSWNCYGLSIRCLTWMQELAARGDRIAAADRQALCAEVARQVRFLTRNLELDLGGNHLLKDATALVWAGRFFAGDEARRWQALGGRVLRRELREQVLPDGCHFERSFSYHADVMLDLVDCHEALEDAALRDEVGSALDAMAQVLADTTHPDGGTSLFNDAGLSKGPSPETCLRAYAAVRGKVPPAPRAVFGLASAGYFGLRAVGELLLADCGAIAPDWLPAHGHGDILAFEWSAGGTRIVVDFGVHEYTAGAWRARSRATASHNTVTVGDEDQCEFWSAFRVGRRAKVVQRRFEPTQDGFVLEGAHDGYAHLAGAPVHSRTFRARPGRIEVEDEVCHGSGQPVRARILFHPECRVTLGGAGASVAGPGVRVGVTFACTARVQRSWWCPELGTKVEADQLVLEYGAAPCRGAFTLTLQRGE